MPATVLVLDFGSQFTQLIARRIRECGVYSEIRPCTSELSTLDRSQVRAIILSGGPASVTDPDAPKFDPAWLATGLPTLGVCYGMQLMAHLLGGGLARGAHREYGFATLEVQRADGLFQGFDLKESTTVWMSHGDHVEHLPPGFSSYARTEGCPIASMGDSSRNLYAVQFHPEVVHSARGKEMIESFLALAKIERDWTPEHFIQSSIDRVRAQVDNDSTVICALSGGVDSTVAAALVHRAIGDRLLCLFVDNGLLRKHEGDQVIQYLGKLGLNVRRINAADRFLSELAGCTDPEKKRKIIGRIFIEVFDDESKKLSKVTHLVQGTLYPDVIESLSVRGPSATIKTHHNVGGLPERMKLKLIEPFRELFKDEVRRVGVDLDVPDEILHRQPFPGPGLAVRVLGEVTPERLHLLREADAIFHEEIVAAGLYRTIWQSFAVLLPIKSVGVMGDGRTYEQTIALRAVTSEDGMTADWVYLPHELLRRVSTRIINEVRGINRVVLDISSKPPATIEWE